MEDGNLPGRTGDKMTEEVNQTTQQGRNYEGNQMPHKLKKKGGKV